MSRRIVVASGYFSFLHCGHIEYLQKAKSLGDVLIVIVNNDKQEVLKKGKVLVPVDQRIKIIRELRCVDMVVESVDEDRTVCKTLSMLHPHLFVNGGDQYNDSIPEAKICKEMGIELVDGLGKKIQSSSALIEKAKTIRNYKKL